MIHAALHGRRTRSATAPDQLIARRIGAMGIGLYAHRDCLAGRAAPDSIAVLKDHALIGFDQATAFQRRIMANLSLDPKVFVLRCDSDLASWRRYGFWP